MPGIGGDICCSRTGDAEVARGAGLRIAYLILCHGQPAQIRRLVMALPLSSPIFIHVDARTSAAVHAEIHQLAYLRAHIHFVPRHRCFWSGYGIVKATNQLIISALASGEAFDRATLLSGADYPIKSQEHINAFFENAGDAEFIEAFPLHAPNRWSNHEGLYHGASRVDWFHVRFRSRAWRSPWRRRLPLGYEPWGGGQWWTLTRPALELIADVARKHPALPRFFRNVFLPDESYFQTLLGNSRFRGAIAGDDLRLVIWDRPEPPYPAILKARDIECLAESDKLFARKFDLYRNPEIYELIDARFLRRS